MTKKNSAKVAARARQKNFGGKFLHHRRIAAGDANERPRDPRLSVEETMAIAAQTAHDQIVGATDLFGDLPFVYVVVDAADAIGGAIAATRIAQMKRITAHAATSEIATEVSVRHAENKPAPFAGVMTVEEIGTILHEVLGPAQIDVVVRFAAGFSSPAPADRVHVLVAAASELRIGHVSAIEVCIACKHSVAQHDPTTGICTWVGAREAKDIPGLSELLDPNAREVLIPMICPCGGVRRFDGSYRPLPK